MQQNNCSDWLRGSSSFGNCRCVALMFSSMAPKHHVFLISTCIANIIVIFFHFSVSTIIYFFLSYSFVFIVYMKDVLRATSYGGYAVKTGRLW